MRLCIVIPVLNEANIIESSAKALIEELDDAYDAYEVRIVDNGSTDTTPNIIDRLSDDHDAITAHHVGRRGKARAIRAGWEASNADVLGFIDADLAPDITSIPRLTRTASDSQGLSIASRNLRTSNVRRPVKRTIISHAYNAFIRLTTGSAVKDHQCGLKCLHRSYWEDIKTITTSTEWFLDTELILHANNHGRPIHEHAITWKERGDDDLPTARVAAQILKRLTAYYAEHGFTRLGADLTTHQQDL